MIKIEAHQIIENIFMSFEKKYGRYFYMLMFKMF